MTGDGLHFALAGAELAAAVALECPGGTHADRSRAPGSRGEATGGIQCEVAFQPRACDRWSHRRAASAAAAVAAKVAPSIFEGIIRYAGDCSRIPDPGSRIPVTIPVRRHRRASPSLPRCSSWPAKPCCRRSTSACCAQGRDRAARRCDRQDALGLSAVVHRDGRRRGADRARAARRADVGPGALRLREGAQDVGDRLARIAMELPRAGAARRAARSRPGRIASSRIRTTWRWSARSSASPPSCGRRSPACWRRSVSAG